MANIINTLVKDNLESEISEDKWEDNNKILQDIAKENRIKTTKNKRLHNLIKGNDCVFLCYCHNELEEPVHTKVREHYLACIECRKYYIENYILLFGEMPDKI